MGQLTVPHSTDSSLEAALSKITKKRLVGLLVRCSLLFSCAFLLSCSKVDKRKAEAPPVQVTNAVPAEPTNQVSSPPAPDLGMVEEAVKRVFGDSALLDKNRKPIFVTGDFNGDLSQDVAVVLRPAPDKLSNLNEEFPRWIIRDLFERGESRVPRLRVAANEALLAIIHGYEANGWRDPQATQTYLLKNAVGSGMQTHQAKVVTAATTGKKVPRFRGEVIGEVLNGTSGYVYYAEATYSWYDSKTFRGEAEPGMFHGGSDRRVKK